MEENTISNAAQRLLDVMSVARKQPPQTKMEEVWRSSANLPKDSSRSDVTRLLVGFLDQMDAIERQLRAMRVDGVETYTKSFDSIRAAIDPVLLNHQKEDAFDKHMTGDEFARLEFCSLELEKVYPEDEINKAELQELLELVDSLSNEISESTLTSELKRSLLDAMMKIRASIMFYEIHGAQEIRAAIQQLIGVNFTEAESMASADQAGKLTLARVGELIDKGEKVTARGMKVYKLVRHPLKAITALVVKALDTPEDVSNDPNNNPED